MKTPGIYVLTLRLPRRIIWKNAVLPSGWYSYTGSAMNGLEGRVSRHIRTRCRRHWHVDALLSDGAIRDVQLLPARDVNMECAVAGQVASQPGALCIPGFGAGDCRCVSHLSRFVKRPVFSVQSCRVEKYLPRMMAVLGRHYVDHAARNRDPFRTLVTCMLSLRTRDPVTDKAAARLFEVISTPDELAVADTNDVANAIYPVGMYRQKAETLRHAAQRLLDSFQGRVPSDIDALITLPGVGRKTANLVRSFSFHLPALCVDTHVHRITNRWGFVRTATPEDSERGLRAKVPEPLWNPMNPFLVQHGQQICRPRQPRCGCCFLNRWCGYPRLLEEADIAGRIPGAPAHPSLKLPVGGQ